MLLFAAGTLRAQTAAIKGTVSDSATGEYLPSVTVVLGGQGRFSATDVFGNFQLTRLQAGKYNLVCSYLGYKTQTISVELAEGETKIIPVKLKPAPMSLAEVTVTASRDIGQTMTLINQVDKERRPTNSAQDLLRLVPGLIIAQHAGGGKAEQIFLRGFDSDHGTDFAVSIDGMPVNMVSHAHGQGYADFHFVIPETVDELKVYKGPYSPRFGDFATSGAGEFSTRNGLDRSTVKMECGLFDTYRALAMVDLLGDKHLFSKQQENAYIAAEYVYSNSYFESPQHFNRHNIFAKYHGRLNDRTSLSVSLSDFSADWDASGQVPERAIAQNRITRFGSIDNTEGGTTSRANANVTIASATRNGALFRNQFFYSHYRFDLFSNFTFFLNDSINGDGINQSENGRNIFGYNGTFEKQHKLGTKNVSTHAGIGTRMDEGDLALKHSVRREVLDTVVSGHLSQQNMHAWLEETISLTDKFSVNAGLRFDQFLFSFVDFRNDSLTGKNQKGRVSPKLNFYYNVSESFQLFVRSGIGFHSNDARSVVSGQAGNSLPRAYGCEAGSTFKIGKRLLINAALWNLDLENELVYVGDEGVVEISGATRRLGVDFALRLEIGKYLFADADINYNHGRFLDLPEGENYIPLAPVLTSTGGITLKKEKGFSGSIRYRCVDSRPANENNTVTAKGYFLLDAVIGYTLGKFNFGLAAENLLNSDWNEAQFDTESRLLNETQAVSELHFTPGTPFFVKGSVAFSF
ncbi:MAG: TonB-dependent receptor plug [Bacteroidetes bacterium]|nr:MAG: TonB-dependent receptor plug [Bacteroidota bacterium]